MDADELDYTGEYFDLRGGLGCSLTRQSKLRQFSVSFSPGGKPEGGRFVMSHLGQFLLSTRQRRWTMPNEEDGDTHHDAGRAIRSLGHHRHGTKVHKRHIR